MRFDKFSFGSIQIDGVTCDYDVVIDGGEIRKRKKGDIPWRCRRLVVGTGVYGRLPVMNEVKREAERRRIKLLVVPTPHAIEALEQGAGRAAISRIQLQLPFTCNSAWSGP